MSDCHDAVDPGPVGMVPPLRTSPRPLGRLVDTVDAEDRAPCIPRMEVDALMGLLNKFLQTEAEELVANNIRLDTIGETDRLPDDDVGNA